MQRWAYHFPDNHPIIIIGNPLKLGPHYLVSFDYLLVELNKSVKIGPKALPYAVCTLWYETGIAVAILHSIEQVNKLSDLLLVLLQDYLFELRGLIPQVLCEEFENLDFPINFLRSKSLADGLTQMLVVLNEDAPAL